MSTDPHLTSMKTEDDQKTSSPASPPNKSPARSCTTPDKPTFRKALHKLKNDLRHPDTSPESDIGTRNERLRDIERMKREFESLMDDDDDLDDDVEAELVKNKQAYFRDTLAAFEDEIRGEGAGVWRHENALRTVKRLRREFESFVMDNAGAVQG